MNDDQKSQQLLAGLIGDELVLDEPMSRHTTLRVGGNARFFWPSGNIDKLSAVLTACWKHEIPYLLIGHGSNLLVSDSGFPSLIIQNRCKKTQIPVPGTDSIILSECGVSLSSLFLQTAKAGFNGLEWAVGIPGTVGGALVSNAGAYRGNIGPLIRSVRVFADGEDKIVGPEWMEFSYRDSKLRRSGIGRTVVLACTLEAEPGGNPDEILDRAKYYQEQRKLKQPFSPSAGSFFKNVVNKELAESLPGLPQQLKDAGVVPAGFLIDACGLKGLTVGGAQASEKHANFLINTGTGATAADFRALAAKIKATVKEKFGAVLEEEVLFVGEELRVSG
jgi:UDP-N-acetylmuramate dehydrogenase